MSRRFFIVKRRFAACCLFLLSLALILSSCGQREQAEKISLKAGEKSAAAASGEASAPKPLRVAVAAMISPKETFVSYKDLMNYIGEKAGMPVELVQRETYQEINELLKKNEIDVAFVCTGAYIDGKADFDMELLVAPLAYGEPVYYSYIIVPKESKATDLADLRGKKFAFTDPISNTGKLAPTYMLALMGETPEKFFASSTFTYSHDKSIESVARGNADAAAVDSLVWDYMNKKNPQYTSKTRILKKSPPYGIPPVVVSKALNPALKSKIKEFFLAMHEDPAAKPILGNIMIDKFVVVQDSIYDSVRAMKKWVEGNSAKK